MEELLTEDRRVILEYQVSTLERIGIKHTGDEKIEVSDLRAALNTIDHLTDALADRDRDIRNYEQAIDRLSKGMALTLPPKGEKPDEFGLTPSQYKTRVDAPYQHMSSWLVLSSDETVKGTVIAENSRQALIEAQKQGLLVDRGDFVREVVLP